MSQKDSARHELGAGDFQSLLNRLALEPEEAARRYEQLRRKLIQYFLWEQCHDAESLTDDCFDRVARKLEDGTDIQNLNAYIAGVARIVLKEWLARRRRENTAFEGFAKMRADAGAANLEAAVSDLNQCLLRFSSDQRSLILRYYQGDHAQRIANRKRLAEELGVQANALRNRAMRLREVLEECMAGRWRDRSATGTTKGRSESE